MVVTEQKEAADRLNVSPRTLRDWRTSHLDFPDCSKGYDLHKIEEWRKLHSAKGSQTADQAGQLSLAHKAHKVRFEKARADRAEREEQIAKGNILPLDEFTTSVSEIITLTRDRLASLPATLSKHVPRKYQRTLRREAERAIEKILNEMARMIENTTETAGDT